jgi:hypothetical protein
LQKTRIKNKIEWTGFSEVRTNKELITNTKLSVKWRICIYFGDLTNLWRAASQYGTIWTYDFLITKRDTLPSALHSEKQNS